MSADKRVRPFSSGSQYMDWTASNCESTPRCSKYLDPDDVVRGGADFCELAKALAEGCIFDGTISAKQAERLDVPREAPFPYVWPCPEHDPPWKKRGDE